ncbi:MAG: twin-arginine translocation signal domain-containing protein [Gemmataceae bacterium]
MKTPEASRRQFLQATGATVAAPTIITSTALGQDRSLASNRISWARSGAVVKGPET